VPYRLKVCMEDGLNLPYSHRAFDRAFGRRHEYQGWTGIAASELTLRRPTMLAAPLSILPRWRRDRVGRWRKCRSGGVAASLGALVAVRSGRGGAGAVVASAVAIHGGARAVASASFAINAALGSSLFAVIGVILWDTHWKGSAFSLNLFKCLVGTFFFVAMASATANIGSGLGALTLRSILALCASSFVGVVVGDFTWLVSLQILGARRVILVDALRPFIAAAAGGLFLRETFSALDAFTMLCTVIGTLVVAIERESDTEAVEATSRRLVIRGYALAILTVLLDVWGMLLLRQFGGGLGPWLIGGLRFGAAAACMGTIAAVCYVATSASSRPWRQRLATQQPPSAGSSILLGEDEKRMVAAAEVHRGHRHQSWWKMPSQSGRAWTRVAAGAFFVTFLSPALSTYALFAMPLSLCLTLMSLSPVLALPLVVIMKRERISVRTILGSAMAVAGAAVFCGISGNAFLE